MPQGGARQPGLHEPVPWAFGRDAAGNEAIAACQQRTLRDGAQ